MPVPPAELTAHFTVEGPDEARSAATGAAGSLAREAGPGEVMVAGAREEVLGALHDAVSAALDAGATGLQVRFEAPTESRP